MTKPKFAAILSRLESYYSNISGSKVKIDEWARNEYYSACFCVFDIDADRYYSDLVSEFKFFPRVTEFREAAEKYRKNKTRYQNDETCYCCMDTGTVPYLKKGLKPYEQYEYTHFSRCYCESGKNKPDWPLCTQVLQRDEIEWLESENIQRYGNVARDEGQKAKEYVTRFVKAFATP